MVAINPEMLRELLEEFTEKEEVTREEMNAINQQIAELEKRIESSKTKLAGLNKDRDKITAMRERYLSGNWKLQLSNMADNHVAMAQSVQAEAPAPVAPPTPAAPQTPAEGRAARRAAREAANQANQTPVPAAVPESVEAATAPAVEAPQPVEAPVFQDVTNQMSEPELQSDIQTADSAAFALDSYEEEIGIEHAPPDDPIMSSFNSAAASPEITASFGQNPPPAPAAQPVAELENSGFSWSSTAINAVETPVAATPVTPANPWGDPQPSPVATAPVEQRQSPADIWGHPEAAQAQAPAQNSPAPAAGGWGDFGEDWQMAEAQRVTGNKIPTIAQPVTETPPENPGGGWGQPAGSPWGTPQAPAADVGGGGWGRPTASRQNMPAMTPPGAIPGPAINSNPSTNAAPPSTPVPAAEPGDAWGRSSQSTAGWGTQGSPWGDPAGQVAPAAPASQAPAQLPGTSYEQPPEGESAPSSLARAADGALISPVKGRRRSTGAPAAFDWGSPDSGNAQDSNQAGGSEDPNDNKKIDDVLKGLFK